MIRKLAVYVILESTRKEKEALTISVGDNESAKYRLSVANELKIVVSIRCINHLRDGLTGIVRRSQQLFQDGIPALYCVHQVRNIVEHVPDKDRKPSHELKTIYQATMKRKALQP